MGMPQRSVASVWSTPLLATARVRLGEWLRRPDIQVALYATLALRVLSSVIAALLPQIFPAIYPWWGVDQADHFTLVHHPYAGTHPLYTPLGYLIQPWARWDTVWYVDIAEHGYATYGASAFMPGFPALMRLFAPLAGGDPIAAGLLVSSVAAFFALVALFRLGERLAPGRHLGGYLVLAASLLPTSFFLVAAYSESTFLALTFWALLAAWDGQWWRVALLGGLAALVRQQGVLVALLAAPAMWQWLSQAFARARGSHGSLRMSGIRRAMGVDTRWDVLTAASAPLVSYGAWLGALALLIHAPMPWAPLTAQHAWNLHLALPWTGLWADAVHWVQHFTVFTTLSDSAVLDLVFSLAGLAGLVAAARRMPPGFSGYFAALWLVSMVKVLPSGITVSESRYMLQLLPLAVIPAGWMAGCRPAWRVLLSVGAAIMLVWYLSIFILGGWVA